MSQLKPNAKFKCVIKKLNKNRRVVLYFLASLVIVTVILGLVIRIQSLERSNLAQAAGSAKALKAKSFSDGYSIGYAAGGIGTVWATCSERQMKAQAPSDNFDDWYDGCQSGFTDGY